MEEIQLAFKDATSVPPDPDGKQQHVVEICNFVDAATSTWLMAEARSDFHAETAASSCGAFPYPLWVSASDDEFSAIAAGSAVTVCAIFPKRISRFLLCLGIQPNICPKL